MMAKASSAFAWVNSVLGADCFSLKCYVQFSPLWSKKGCHQTEKNFKDGSERMIKGVEQLLCEERMSKLQLLSLGKRYCKGRRKRSLKSWVYWGNWLGINFPIPVQKRQGGFKQDPSSKQSGGIIYVCPGLMCFSRQPLSAPVRERTQGQRGLWSNPGWLF